MKIIFNLNKSLKSIATLIFACAFMTYANAAEYMHNREYLTGADLKQNHYSFAFSIDKDMSSTGSADFALSAIEGYRMLDDKFISNSDSIFVRGLGYFTRFIFTQFIMVAQHEIGGHGYRARESGVKVRSYEINLLDGSGSTSLNAAQFNKLHIHEKIAIDTGGMQATYLLSQKISDRYFDQREINPTLGIAYAFSSLDQPMYIYTTKKGTLHKNDGNDVANYIKGVNSGGGANPLTLSKMRGFAAVDLLDPLLYFSLYSYIFNENIAVPMIEFNGYGYLPAFRSVLAPFGPEYRFINHIRLNETYLRVHLGYGKNKKAKAYHAGVKTNYFLKYDNFALGGELDLWRGPELLTIGLAKQKVGGLVELNSKLSTMKDIALLFSVGYKTNGFIEGRPLKKSMMIRAGLEFKI